MSAVDVTDCRSSRGVAVGLVDSVITSLRVLRRHYGKEDVSEALKDLEGSEDWKWLMVEMYYRETRDILLDASMLSMRSYNVLVREGVKTIGELSDLTAKQFKKYKGAGLGCLSECQELLATHDLPGLE